MASNVNPQMLLTRHNYQSWSINMRRILQTEGLIAWIDAAMHPKEMDKLPALEQFKLNQSKAKAAGIIKTYCSQEIVLMIDNLDKPEVIWQTLKDNLQTASRSYKSLCLAEFRNMRPNPDEELPTFIDRFEHQYRKVTDAGENVSEDHRCYMLLQTLPEDFDYLAREFENCGTSDFNFAKLKDEVIKEYNRRNLHELSKTSECLSVEKAKNSQSFKPRSSIKCNYCNMLGHLEDVCRFKKFKNQPSTNLKESSFITEYISECFESEGPLVTQEWTLDSASTSHICQNRDFFINLRPSQNGSVIKMGTTTHPVIGIGVVKFKIRDGLKMKEITLKECLYVPTIHRNLISMSRMDKAGLHAKLDRGFKIFNSKWMYLWSARMKNNFYVIQGIPIKTCSSYFKDKVEKFNLTPKHDTTKTFSPEFDSKIRNIPKETVFKNQNFHQAFAMDTNDIMMWHERLAHCNLPTIKKMFNKDFVEPQVRLKGIETCCEACVMGKNTRQPYPSLKSIRSKEILELVHTDIWGPAPHLSKHGYRYILTFLDDFSRRAFCYPMRHKSEVCEKLKNFIHYIERQTDRKIKAFRSDNGLEYCCTSMQRLLESLGIKHERSNIYSPQSNGAAERLNRILFDGMRTLINSANLPEELWLEAMQTTRYIRNRLPHSSTGETPFKRWFGKKPSLRHLKRYGCVAYAHIPSQKRNKFQVRAQKGILVGYSYSTKGYRIWLPSEDKIIETKHVKFDETKLGMEKQGHIISLDTDEELDMPTTFNQTQTEEKPEIAFERYITTRKTGESKGKEDIYVKTPEGKTLRSSKELENYCNENNIIYDPSLKIFSKDCKILGIFKLKQKLPFPTENLNPISETYENFEEEANFVEVIIPKTAREAKSLPEANEWKKAMDSEIKTMINRNVWTIVPRPVNKRVIGTRWVYTLKDKDKSRKFKARLVALGNNQREGLDYNETYSPVVNFTLIRLFMALLVCILHWRHSLLDVKCAYLYGDIDRDIYINQPVDYEKPGQENHVLKLNKALYGLHQSGKCWYEELHHKLITNGFTEIPGLTCVYRYRKKAIIMVYVDDLPVFAEDQSTLLEVIHLLESLYELENLGPITQLLGIQFSIKEDVININCRQYIDSCVKRFGICTMTNTSLPIQPGTVSSKQESPSDDQSKAEMEQIPYRNLLGCLLYISGRCRPDISYAVATLAQVTENPARIHWNRLCQVLKYLASTKSLGLQYCNKDSTLQVSAFADASWASDPSDRRSYSGYGIFLNGMPVTWRVKKQTCVSLSPMEAEFISASEAAKDLKYIKRTIDSVLTVLDLQITIQRPLFWCDNAAAIQFIKFRSENIRNRYIDLKYMFVRELHEKGQFEIKHVRSQENVADLLTKALCKEMFCKLRSAYLAESASSL